MPHAGSSYYGLKDGALDATTAGGGPKLWVVGLT